VSKIITVIGARPQFVKAAVVSRALSLAGGCVEILLHTGQHYDENMSQVFFDQLEIPAPSYNLCIGSALHGVQTGAMLHRIEEVLLKEHPDAVLVYGDTNSTLAGALAAAKLHIPVAHVEAGLRSFNRRMPEEINRVVTDHLAELLFAPTAISVRNLLREGISDGSIHQVGDVMYDAALFYAAKAAESEDRLLARLGLERGGYVLATVHRAENTDDRYRLSAIFEGLAQLATTCRVVMPLHPRTRAALVRAELDQRILTRLSLIEPVAYLDMVVLERHARLIVTDSGGVQKEAFFYGVPCATLRDQTEWTELLDCGWNTLVPPRSVAGVAAGLLERIGATPPPAPPALYGDGAAGAAIARIMKLQLGG